MENKLKELWDEAKKSKREEENKPEITPEEALYGKAMYIIETNKELLKTNDGQDELGRMVGAGKVMRYIREHPIQEKKPKEKTQEEIEELLPYLKHYYYEIKNILSNYLDISEDHKTISALWIIGTWYHNSFSTFPYLFINSMKGSGKTRFLKLIEALCWQGKLTNNLSEAVLFRTAQKHTILIDEFEGVGGKNANVLRELLNSAYKKGSVVERMKKVREGNEEKQVVEQFELYTPVAMANIWGMNEVLGDRCINLVLDKSEDWRVTSLIEDFSSDPVLQHIKANFQHSLVQLCSYFAKNTIPQKWNTYVNQCNNYIYTLHTYTTLNQQTTLDIPLITTEEREFFEKIKELHINGRALELFFPLFIIAKNVDNSVVECILEIAGRYVQDRKMDEMIESSDVSLLNFVSAKSSMEYYSVLDLTREFKYFYEGEEETEGKWLNAKWMGRALKRLNLVLSKRRVTKGIEVMLKVNEAKRKIGKGT